jgi:hypothetical protein
MKETEMLIKIPEEVRELVCNIPLPSLYDLCRVAPYIQRAIINGTPIERCEKAVSVQDCINVIENTDCELSPQAWKEITTSIISLPPAMPTPKKGKWIEVDTNRYTCSNCSHCFTIIPEDNRIEEFKCCPNCRTEMEEVVQSDFLICK